jgi:hypothetical protein
MVSILDKLVDKQGGTMRSGTWYQNAISSIADNVTASKLMRDGRLTGRPSIGLLNMFFYDPKYKKTLPVYDTFPLVLPLEPIEGGFSGLNFHYLPPALRLRLLELMQKWATNNKMDKTTKFDVSWSRVKNIPLIKPTIKKYLYKHVRSSFLRIDLTQAAIAVYLPVQQFQKQSAASVYKASRSSI